MCFGVVIKSSLIILIVAVLLNIVIFIRVPIVLNTFFRTILKLSFLWIIYLLCSLLFDINFDEQAKFLLRFLLLLQLSAFILKSFSQKYILKKIRFLLKYKFFQNIYYYFIFVFQIFKHIIESYKKAEIEIVIHKKQVLSNFLEKNMKVIKSIFDNFDNIKKELFLPINEQDTTDDNFKYEKNKGLIGCYLYFFQKNLFIISIICIYTGLLFL
ncbi:MAG: hypothetical protein FWG98_10940 [Candidatus Cloacimonetes bacterium]|nr:hypothetical protein [Candidatus Cloacimonadota bacterium]